MSYHFEPNPDRARFPRRSDGGERGGRGGREPGRPLRNLGGQQDRPQELRRKGELTNDRLRDSESRDFSLAPQVSKAFREGRVKDAKVLVARMKYFSTIQDKIVEKETAFGVV